MSRRMATPHYVMEQRRDFAALLGFTFIVGCAAGATFAMILGALS